MTHRLWLWSFCVLGCMFTSTAYAQDGAELFDTYCARSGERSRNMFRAGSWAISLR
jgi:hypothetical protein